MITEPKYRRWSFHEEIILLQHWQGASSAEKIAKLLKVDSSRVLEKAHQLRLGSGTRGKNYKWSEEELEYLATIAETNVLDKVVEKYNIKAKQNNWHYRTKSSIEKKIKLLGYSSRPLVGYITITELTIYLGRTSRYIQGLVEQKLLPVHKVGNKYIYVKEKDFIKFAKRYPLEVGEKMTREGIIWFLQILESN